MPATLDLVRRLFFEKHVCTAAEVQAWLHAHGEKRSIVSVYAALGQLLEDKVLLKEHAHYHLSVSWLLDARLRLEQVCASALRSAKGLNLEFLSTGARQQRLHWRFASLGMLNEFWVQILMLLFERSSSKLMYQYVPRLWFPHVAPEQDQQYQRAFHSQRTRIELLVGGSSYLDREPAERRPNPFAYRCHYARSRFSVRRTCYYCVLDDYLVTVRIPAALAKELDLYFEKTKSLQAGMQAQLQGLLSRRMTCSLVIERGTPRQRKTRSAFESYLKRR